MSTQDKVTIQYMVWESNNIYDESLKLPIMPKIGIAEILNIDFVDHEWVVTSSELDASSKWVGRDGYRQIAILNYLKARLGHYEIERADGQND